MKAIRDIKRKIAQKEDEVRDLRERLFKAEAFLDGLQESLRLFEKSSGVNGGGGLRPNSTVDKVFKMLKQAGAPMHANDLLRAIGKEPTKKNKQSLAGSLGFYVRQGEIFTRPAPNTFGLVEFGEVEVERELRNELPEGFGQ